MPSHPLPHPRQGRAKSAPPEAREATAQYIAEMTAELAGIAETAQLDLLTYFLKMAQMEAESCLRSDD